MVANKHKSKVDEDIEEPVVEDDDVKEIKEDRHSKAKQEAEQYKNLYLRALADYKNLEHRMDQARQSMRFSIKKEMATELLPIMDTLEQAEVFNNDPGLKMIRSSFMKALENMGVKEVELLGTEFDPQYAEVIEVVPGKEDDIVIDVIQKAFALGGQVMRHGKVRVSKKS